MPVAKPEAVENPLSSPSNQREDTSSSTTLGRSETLRFPPSYSDATTPPTEDEISTDRKSLMTWSSERAAFTSRSEEDFFEGEARVDEIIAARYELQERIGAGAMGVVWRAQDRKLGIPVAIKLVSSQLTLADQATLRLREEASILKRIDSPYVARIVDAGQSEGGSPYLVTELLRGETLQTVLEKRTCVTLVEAVDWIGQAAAGLADVHAAGLVHDDIKPSNVFLIRSPDEPPAVKLLDFGVAHALSSRIIGQDTVLGSPWYLAPERLAAHAQADQRSDIWSLGVILYELVAGRRPFEGQSLEAVCASVISSAPIPLRSWRPDVSPELEAIVSRCLQPRPEDRYPDARALAIQLRELQVTLGSSLAPTVSSTRPSATELQPPSGFPRPSRSVSDASSATWRPRQLARPRVSRRRWPAVFAYVLAGSLVLSIGVSAALQRFRSNDVSRSTPTPRLEPPVQAAPQPNDRRDDTQAAVPPQPASSPDSENQAPSGLRDLAGSDTFAPPPSKPRSDLSPQSRSDASTGANRSPARAAAPSVRVQRIRRTPRSGNATVQPSRSEAELGIPVNQVHINRRGELVDAQGRPLESSKNAPKLETGPSSAVDRGPSTSSSSSSATETATFAPHLNHRSRF